MKIAAAAYPLTPMADWDTYVAHMGAWVAQAAEGGANLLVFPEYGRMELATLEGMAAAADLEASLAAVDRWAPRADELTAELAARHGVHILAGSGPVFDGGARPVN
ncbi:MAG: amidohydrolase, partial [Roseicyclus sp.]